MDKHKKKMIAPIIVTVLVVTYYLFFFGMLIKVVDGMMLKIIIAVFPALIAATMIGVCIQRIKEIKGGEEDDLGKY